MKIHKPRLLNFWKGFIANWKSPRYCLNEIGLFSRHTNWLQLICLNFKFLNIVFLKIELTIKKKDVTLVFGLLNLGFIETVEWR